MKRKITRLLLSAVLMMCCTVSALAQLGTPPNDEIWYTTTDGNTCTPYKDGVDVFGATIISNKYENGHGTIKFDGNVTGIGESAFEDCYGLNSVTIPNSVTGIGKYAFYQCSNLTSITIPNSVTYIGKAAFEDCNGLNSVTIPNSVTSIGEYAFEYCSNLSSVTIPNSVTSIGWEAFRECTSLTQVAIPNSVSRIESSAFDGCTNLRDVFFGGENNITLGDNVFYRTPATIYVGDKTKFPETWGGRPVLSWRSGNGDGTRESPYEIENYMNLYGFSLEVLQGNTSICGKLTADITANNNVLKADGTLAGVFKPWEPIGGQGYGFRGEFDGGGHIISGLYFNDANRQAVGLFGKAAGSEESNSPDRSYIHDVGVRDSYFNGISHVGGICGDFALGRMENCWNAATVQSVNSVAGGIAGSCWRYAFMSGCYNIGKVSEGTESGGVCGIVSKNNEVDHSVSNCVSLEGKCSVAYNLYPTTSQTYADDGGAKVNNVYILNDSKFASGDVCWILNGEKIDTKWRQQIVKDSYPVWTGNYLVNHSDGKGYYNETMCEKENGIHSFIKEEVKRCNNSTFVYWHCSACYKDFTDADRTKEETVANKSSHFPEYVMGIVPTETTKGRYGYYQCTSCHKKFKDELCSESWANENDLIVPEAKKTEIWYTSINNEVIPPYMSGVFGATINANTYIRGLGVITFNKDVTSIGDEAFNGFYSDFSASLQTISIPSSVTSIGNSAFKDCHSLQSINLPSGVTSIGNSAFTRCSTLQSINIPSGVTSIRQFAFSDCSSLQSINIPFGVTSIGQYAFSGCASLQSINIPSGVTSIGEFAFLGCASLQSINIPSGVTSIGQFAFSKCGKMESINIPSGVTSIGEFAFSECSKMESATFHSIPSFGYKSFADCNSLSTKILDLTDSDKPYIGTSLSNYPGGFTKARYHRTLANNGTTWGTITLPFVPASTEGLKFYTLKDATSDKVVLTEVTDIKAGVPYLFKNYGENAEFTLTATDPTVVVNPVEQEAINGMKLVGAFRKDEFTGDGTKYGLYGGNTFMTTTGTLTINPFRAYLETAVSGAKAIVIDNEADGIDDIRHLSSAQSQEGVNVQGMRVGNSYKGIVIKNGKKYLNK
ncbi:MAG: leucine-rich repeat domain-containing protein [Bacteroidaceae bacterium]|nr:leucine-rich repeat domain-containing protein [Bacteroidaceae bacterium]